MVTKEWPSVLTFFLGKDNKGQAQWQSKFKHADATIIVIPHRDSPYQPNGNERRFIVTYEPKPLHVAHNRKTRTVLAKLVFPK